MTTLEIAASAAGLAFFGAHLTAPLSAVRQSVLGRWWPWLALPLAVTAVALMLVVAGQQPDTALAAGVAPGLPRAPARAATVLVIGALLADLLMLISGLLTREHSFQRPAWWLSAALGAGGLVGWSWLAELLRAGQGSAASGALAVAIVCRVCAGAGAGELITPGPSRFGPIAAAALLAYPLTLPAELRQALAARGDLWTLGAAAALVGAARLLPVRFGRAALLAGTLLAGVWFARAASVSAALAPLTIEEAAPAEPF